MVQGWKLYVSNAECAGLIPGLGNKIPMQCGTVKKKKLEKIYLKIHKKIEGKKYDELKNKNTEG